MYTLIKNTRIIDGQKNSATSDEKKDIFIVGNKISAIGSFPDRSADEVIDMKGAYCVPGFIDIDTISDRYMTLLNEKGQDDFLMRGTTTIIGGQCGISLAPLLVGNNVSSSNPWLNIENINLNWSSMGEFISELERSKVGVNFGTFVGHTTVRSSFFPDKQKLYKNELASLLAIFEKALSEGALGISFRMDSKEFTSATSKEINSLLKIIKNQGKVASFHLGDYGDNIHNSLQDAIKLALSSECKTLITHLLPSNNNWEEFKKCIATIDEIPKESQIYFSANPSKADLVPLIRFLPAWIRKRSMTEIVQSIHDGWLTSKITKDMHSPDPNEVVIANSTSHPFLIGRSLADIMESYGMSDPKQALVALMVSTNLQVLVYTRRGEKSVYHERMLVGSHIASGKNIINEHSFFDPLFQLSDEGGEGSIVESVARLTSRPAKFLGLTNRGLIKEGYIADIVGLAQNDVSEGYASPDILFTMVNGKLAMKEGVIIGSLAGSALGKNIK